MRHRRTKACALRRNRRLAASLLIAGGLALAGCATPPPPGDREAMEIYREANDPLEPMNRAIFDFNLALDDYVLRPVAEAYRDVLPQPVRNGVRNFLNNLRSPVIFANDLMQGEMERAGQTFGRFLTNTFIGLGGIFDVATGDNEYAETSIPFHSEDFGQTLAVWGVEEGPYLVLPVLGPAPPRDATGIAVDSLMDPVGYAVANEHRTAVGAGRFTARGIDARSRNIDTVEELRRSSIDFYATVRSLYRQQRQAEIANGRDVPMSPAPMLSSELDDVDDANSGTQPTD